MSTPSSLKTEQLIESIAENGYAIIKHFLPPEKIAVLGSEAKLLQQSGAMRRAGTGQNNEPRLDDMVRGDFIHWLDKSNASFTQQEFLEHMESLRANLNRSLYLGLFEVENHFAIYPPGTFYRKHLDQFQNNQQRQVSSVLYLNQDWQTQDGGKLRLYLDGENPTPYQDIEPVGGTLVAFLSGRFYHEVLPAKHERMSITGWFRTRYDELL